MDWENVRKIHTLPSAKRYFPPDEHARYKLQFRDRESIEVFCLRMLRGTLLMRKTAGMRRAEKTMADNGDLREKSVLG